jgi:hypothetical protein
MLAQVVSQASIGLNVGSGIAASGIGRKPATFGLLGIENRVVAQHRKVLLID